MTFWVVWWYCWFGDPGSLIFWIRWWGRAASRSFWLALHRGGVFSCQHRSFRGLVTWPWNEITDHSGSAVRWQPSFCIPCSSQGDFWTCVHPWLIRSDRLCRKCHRSQPLGKFLALVFPFYAQAGLWKMDLIFIFRFYTIIRLSETYSGGFYVVAAVRCGFEASASTFVKVSSSFKDSKVNWSSNCISKWPKPCSNDGFAVCWISTSANPDCDFP